MIDFERDLSVNAGPGARVVWSHRWRCTCGATGKWFHGTEAQSLFHAQLNAAPHIAEHVSKPREAMS